MPKRKSEQKKMQPVSPPPGTRPLQWLDNHGVELRHADHVHVQAVAGAFYLTFGQLELPLFEGAPPADLVVPIRPIGRIVVTGEAMKRIVQVMQRVAEAASQESSDARE